LVVEVIREDCTGYLGGGDNENFSSDVKYLEIVNGTTKFENTDKLELKVRGFEAARNQEHNSCAKDFMKIEAAFMRRVQSERPGCKFWRAVRSVNGT
jgi:hypothetical protein